MGTHITAIRSDLIELRLKRLGGIGTTMVEQARSLQNVLGRPCVARIHAVAALRERYARRPAAQPMDRIDRTVLLDQCEVIDRRLHGLLEESRRRRAAESAVADARRDGVGPWDRQAATEEWAFGPFATTMPGSGFREHVSPD